MRNRKQYASDIDESRKGGQMDAAPLRRNRMAASAARRGFARVADLARALSVSEVTARVK